MVDICLLYYMKMWAAWSCLYSPAAPGMLERPSPVQWEFTCKIGTLKPWEHLPSFMFQSSWGYTLVNREARQVPPGLQEPMLAMKFLGCAGSAPQTPQDARCPTESMGRTIGNAFHTIKWISCAGTHPSTVDLLHLTTSISPFSYQ